MTFIDLHVHSSCSDGTFTPAELVRLACDGGIQALAITDHDTVAGVSEAHMAGKERGVEVIPGIEIGSYLDSISIHVLGYGMRVDDPLFCQKVLRMQEARAVRNQEIIHRLQALRLPVSMEELQGYSSGGQLGRPHIARLLIDKKMVKTMQDAFSLYLRRGRPAYVERFKYSAQEAVALIHAAGGVAVIAHPGTSIPRHSQLSRVLYDLKALGMDGVEVYYPDHDVATTNRLEAIAGKIGMLITGGSDFHGDNRPQIMLGNVNGNAPVPYRLLAPVKERIAEQWLKLKRS